MSIIGGIIEAFTKAPNTERLPVSAKTGGLMSSFGAASANTSALSQMTASSWLFSVIDRIASSTAAADWQLFRQMSNGDQQEIHEHPLLSLWQTPNPFYSLSELVETLDQHFELVGEMWIVMIRDSRLGRFPVELWPVRPDRMKPVPDRDKFISGYIYTVGSEKIPLEAEDVIFIRRPSPLDPYRGIGNVQSMLFDIQSEKKAAQWTDAFFQNSATPGGIVELDEDIDEADFDRITARWKGQHQGVNNAHRVAFLERGKWVDRKFTQRDMQFEQLRKLNRDIILGAFGMPLSVMGVTESVNRANAEAGQVMFFENIIVPRLRRIRNEINQNLVPIFGEGLRLDFIDPTPQNREFNLKEATEGYNGGLLTQNEGRARLGEGEIDGGDEFKAAPEPALPMNLSLTAPSQKALKDGTARPDDIDDEETAMERAWRKRLDAEADALVEYVEGFR